MLRNVAEQDISVTVLGQKLSMPICVSPTAFQAMAHPHGELATVRAVRSVDTAMGLSVYSTSSLEDVARESPNTIKFMQMQFYTDRELMVDLLKQAEKAGYKAVLLTVDIPVYGAHKKRENFFLPENLKLANFDSLKKKKGLRNNKELNDYVMTSCDRCVDWETFDWLRSTTSLPFVVKGILTAEDARLAVQHGAQGIMVSNHGARQLDGVPATIEVLPEIVEAVRGTGVEVYMDGGVRLGTDVLKALALGARAVFVGRPVIWGLAYKGEQGVTEVLQKLRDELKVAMALAGCATLKDITPALVMRHTAFSHL
ncbi:2-Hydroxyacid oxidase 1-like isoform X2 [Oculina patagonica]